MIIQAIILTALLSNEPTIVAIPPEIKIEAGRRRGKGDRGKRRGGSGLR